MADEEMRLIALFEDRPSAGLRDMVNKLRSTAKGGQQAVEDSDPHRRFAGDLVVRCGLDHPAIPYRRAGPCQGISYTAGGAG
jgi:hypothetical protein